MAARTSRRRRDLVPGSSPSGRDRRLVALAGEQDDVARAGRLERGLDRLAAVGDELEVLAATLAGRLGTARDGVEDRLAVLAARVLVGDDDQAGALAGDAAHQRALGRVPLAGRAEDDDEPAAARGRGRRQQVEDRRQRGRAVGEVDDHPERLAGVDALHPAGDAAQLGEPDRTAAAVQAEDLAEGDDRQGVVDVEPTGQAQVEPRIPARGRELDVEAGAILGDPHGADVGGGSVP